LRAGADDVRRMSDVLQFRHILAVYSVHFVVTSDASVQ